MPVTSPAQGGEWRIRPARGPALLVALVTLLGILSAFNNALSLWVQLLIAGLVLAAGGVAVHRLLAPVAKGLRVQSREVRLRMPGGATLEGELQGSPFVSPLFVGFRWRPEGRRLAGSLGVFRGQMTGEDFRRLCVALRQTGQ